MKHKSGSALIREVNIFIGYNAGKDELGSNKLYIDVGSDTSNVLIVGDFSLNRVGINTDIDNVDSTFYVEGGGHFTGGLKVDKNVDATEQINTNSHYEIDGDTALSMYGHHNTNVGVAGMSATGGWSVRIGHWTGTNNTGDYNTLVGNSNGRYSSGIRLSCFGYHAGEDNTTGTNNTNIGAFAGSETTEGGLNTYIGTYAGYDNTTGKWNSNIGVSTGEKNITGIGNVNIGLQAGRLATAADSCVMIGFKAGYDNTTSNRLYIANDETTSPLIYGEFDNKILNFDADVTVGRDLEVNNTFSAGKSISLTDNTLTDIFDVALTTLQGTGGTIHYTLEITDGTDIQQETGMVQYNGVNKATVYTMSINESLSNQSLSAGTLTTVWAIASGTDEVIVKLTANSSLTPTAMTLRYSITGAN